MTFYYYVILNFIKKWIEPYKQNQRKYSSINVSEMDDFDCLEKIK